MIKDIANRMFNINSNDKEDNKGGYENIFSGYYAITDPKDGILKFFRIKIPKDGKWKNHIFLSIQASHDFFPIKNKEYRNIILNEIRKDPIGASQRYGRDIGSCGICGLTLTNEESRERGIGPYCWSKM